MPHTHTDAGVHATATAHDQTEASVVIPVRNGESTLAAQLEALTRQDFAGGWEVIVSDNGSCDATVDVANSFRSQLPQLRVVDASDRPGVSFARNTGARAAAGWAIAFCDADDEVHPQWLSGMVGTLRAYDAAAGPLDLKALNPPEAYSDGETIRPLTMHSPVLRFLPYPIGANCAVRRDVWQELDGFDDSIVYGGDEVEFFWRLQVEGYRLGDAADAWVSFRLHPGLKSSMRRGFRSGRASAALFDQFEEHGAHFDASRALRSWIGLGARAYRLAGPKPARQAWLIRAAQQTGRLAGGIKGRRAYF